MLKNTLLNATYQIIPSYHSALVMQLLKTEMIIPDMPKVPMSDDEDMPDVEDAVAIIDINGVLVNGASEEECEYLGLCNYDDIKEQLVMCKDLPLKAIILNINSPGGWVQGSKGTGELIAEINKTIPVYAYASSLCASAAYKLAVNATAIFCDQEAETGCVGTIFTHYDYSKMMDEMGVKPTIFKSGKYKDMFSQDRPMTDEEKAIAQSDIDTCGKAFRDVVLSKRDIEPQYLEGLCYNGKDAVDLGFVDGILSGTEELIKLIVE